MQKDGNNFKKKKKVGKTVRKGPTDNHAAAPVTPITCFDKRWHPSPGGLRWLPRPRSHPLSPFLARGGILQREKGPPSRPGFVPPCLERQNGRISRLRAPRRAPRTCVCVRVCGARPKSPPERARKRPKSPRQAPWPPPTRDSAQF